MTDKITLDEIALDAMHQIKAIPEELHKVQKDARTQLIIFAAMARGQSAMPLSQPRWRHKASGFTATEIARGHAQCSTATICEMDPVVIYIHDGEWWVRHSDEFDDGRFESVP